MKKNVSINIGGVIFHIEEDGFEKLRSYLDSITNYFSSFDDSREIIDDIENRIAEIFLAKLNEVNQVISLTDVEEVIGVMGTTKDFEATIEVDEKVEDQKEKMPETETADEEPTGKDFGGKAASKRLYRDGRRKIFGGVASGIAHYFELDPLWIRLLFIALLVNVFFGGLSGFTVLAYLVLWIVVPLNNELEDDVKLRKLFRSKERNVLGGVCMGLSSYFGIDVAIIRLLFVLSIFIGGAGLIIYIILWIITPEAKTITEKMQMEGEPVTLTNIEDNVKRRLNEREGSESALAKVLLFPFRAVALIIDGFARLFGPAASGIADILRVIVGIFLSLIGFLLMLGFLLAFLLLVGWGPAWWMDYVQLGDFPIELAVSSFAGLSLVSVFLVVFIPGLALTLGGVALMIKRSIGRSYIGWSLFGIWILGLIGTAIFLPSIIKDFGVEGSIREKEEFPLTETKPLLSLNQVGNEDYNSVDLRLRGHKDSIYRLELRIQSRGANRAEAKENASNVNYQVTQTSDGFTFDSNLDFPPGKPFRFQEVDATFYIPDGIVFRMDAALQEILTNTLYLSGYRSYQIEGNDWVFENGNLNCLTCTSQQRSRPKAPSSPKAWENFQGEDVSYNYEDFREIRISSYFKAFIIEGDYKVELKGDTEDLRDIYINKQGDRLEIKHRDHNWGWWEKGGWRDEVAVFISLPDLETLELSGACEANVFGFKDGDMEWTISGASDVEADISPDYLEMNLIGASTVSLEGSARRMKVKVLGASKLSAFNFRAEDVALELKGASQAQIYAIEDLDVDVAGLSSVTYKGDPRLRTNERGMTSVRRY